MKILLTAFDPFGGATVNPAWEVVSRLKEDWSVHTVKKLLVPTVFGEAEALVNGTAAQWGADAVICVGQAGGRFEITFERVAINMDDASIPDNAGPFHHSRRGGGVLFQSPHQKDGGGGADGGDSGIRQRYRWNLCLQPSFLPGHGGDSRPLSGTEGRVHPSAVSAVSGGAPVPHTVPFPERSDLRAGNGAFRIFASL